MGAIHPSIQSWTRVLVLLAGVFVGLGVVAQAACAEGVVGGGAFVAGGTGLGSSLTDALGSPESASRTPATSSPAEGRVLPRPHSPRERADAEAGRDVFQLSRLVMPLMIQATVGSAADEAMIADTALLTSGQPVGTRPNPRIWGSTLGR